MLVCEVLPRRRKLSQLVSHHLLGDQDLQVVLAIVDLELQADEVGKDRGGARLRLDRGNPLAGLRPYNGETGASSAVI